MVESGYCCDRVTVCVFGVLSLDGHGPCFGIAGHPWWLDLPFFMHILLLFQFAYNETSVSEVLPMKEATYIPQVYFENKSFS